MFSVYECGCIAKNVPCTSRCPQHDGYVCSQFNTHIPENDNKKIWRGDNVTLVYNSLHDSISRMEDHSVSLICTYPNQSEFWARQESNLLNFQDNFFRHYYRIIKPRGLVLLFVEQPLILAATYAAHEHNFNVNSISEVRMHVQPTTGYVAGSPKFALLLSKDNDMTLGNFTFKETSQLFETIGFKGTILDTTCMFQPIVLNAVRTNKVIGFCSDFENFKSLVNTLRKRG